MRQTTARWLTQGVLGLALTAGPANLPAALPPPPKDGAMVPWCPPITSSLGAMSAADLLEKPAGRNGPIVIKGSRFYSGEKRIRFWGANTCFSGNFPTHAQADVVAARLASLGINCLRLHHMDMQKFPGGLFADDKLETLSPEALDRLDYFVAALKKHGVYVNINLHVSRKLSRARNMPAHDKLDMDKIVDLFYPELIEAQKQFARDLLGHVNKYTGKSYADEPAVAMVEINNENTMFLWGGDRRIAELPDPYGAELTRQWNAWLLRKYGSLEKLREAWDKGARPLGPNLLANDLVHEVDKPWNLEVHDKAKATFNVISQLAGGPDGHAERSAFGEVNVTEKGDHAWHVQLTHGGIKLKKGQFYTVSFSLSSPAPATVGVSVGQSAPPWQSLGLATSVQTGAAGLREHRVGFVAAADDDKARLQFHFGGQAAKYRLRDVRLRQGGQEGCRAGEDPATGTVARRRIGEAVTQARQEDWFDFLQHVDEGYFVSMREFLRKDLGVKAPITGTIGLGALGTLSQSKMDFVDAHAYWDHPHFPRRSWDSRDWEIANKPMVDNPAGATLWHLAATRVQGKPFTVTEYNHSAPNEWQAECVPVIASFAAAQDWDGVFLFSYSHNTRYEGRSMDGFFDIEGNPAKLAHVATAARLFLGGQMPALARAPATLMLTRQDALRGSPRFYHQLWDQLRADGRLQWNDFLRTPVAVGFDAPPPVVSANVTPGPDTRLSFSAAGPGTGRYAAHVDLTPDPLQPVVFAGFVGETPIELGAFRIERSAAPFVTLIAAPTASPPPKSGRIMLISIVGRAANTGMKWDARRRSVSDQWGKGPALIERTDAVIGVATGGKPVRVFALTQEGTRGEEMKVREADAIWRSAHLKADTAWFEVVRD